MFSVAAVLFAIAAVGGLAMAYMHFKQNRNPPGGLAALHGVLAASGLVVLIWGAIEFGVGGYVAWALGLFVVAALGGFFLLSVYLRGKRFPSAAVVVHGLVAVVAFLLLLAGIFGV
jgi:hypothetical protein